MFRVPARTQGSRVVVKQFHARQIGYGEVRDARLLLYNR